MYAPAKGFYPVEGAIMIDLGEGFKTQVKEEHYLIKHGLLGKGVLFFVNELSRIVEEKEDSLTRDEWAALDFALTRFMVLHGSGELYYYLLHAFGPDAINYNAWVRFASDTSWPVCVRTFADMPTAILEEYGTREWRNRTRRMPRMDIESFLESISSRDDIYGSESLPIEVVEGILFPSLVK